MFGYTALHLHAGAGANRPLNRLTTPEVPFIVTLRKHACRGARCSIAHPDTRDPTSAARAGSPRSSRREGDPNPSRPRPVAVAESRCGTAHRLHARIEGSCPGARRAPASPPSARCLADARFSTGLGTIRASSAGRYRKHPSASSVETGVCWCTSRCGIDRGLDHGAGKRVPASRRLVDFECRSDGSGVIE